jgi:hypothetical protein
MSSIQMSPQDNAVHFFRDRPFNLKGGGYGFLFRSEFFFRTTQEFSRGQVDLVDMQSMRDGDAMNKLNTCIF